MNILPFDKFSLNEFVHPYNDLLLYHGTAQEFESFDEAKTYGGIHLGTRAQAVMRSSKYLLECQVRFLKAVRYKDAVSGWNDKIKAAKRKGAEGIVYLNRYEGIPTERVVMLHDKCRAEELDTMPDSKFAKLVPEAEDSYIIFDPKQIIILNRFSS